MTSGRAVETGGNGAKGGSERTETVIIWLFLPPPPPTNSLQTAADCSSGGLPCVSEMQLSPLAVCLPGPPDMLSYPASRGRQNDDGYKMDAKRHWQTRWTQTSKTNRRSATSSHPPDRSDLWNSSKAGKVMNQAEFYVVNVPEMPNKCSRRRRNVSKCDNNVCFSHFPICSTGNVFMGMRMGRRDTGSCSHAVPSLHKDSN